MSLKIKVYSDYVCPFCFLAKVPFEEAIKGKDVEVEWMPFELRPSPAPKIDPINDPSKLQSWDRFINPTSKSLGVNMKLPNVSPHPYTDLAFEGLHFAKEQGKEKEYNDRVFKAFFQEEQDIGNIDVLTKIAAEIGLDEGEFKESLVTRKYKEAQQKALQHAYNEAEITSVPTFIIGDKRLEGFNSKEIFEKVINDEYNKGV
ncbi:DsbA family oxidoreductase [Clostridium sp. OS1-26]|uniref:DsbA family oxidoreductase n=1 Tax=Clostridium sp. OS1-26 TaxID=3070681 RepID=UPI0027DF657A|nr:DsbA family oxidoreductase [Clostridium sp. OS1-26]WML32575.1 DsbA family oxidoreductase [Clostridium sp. OS1-26]